MLISFFAYEQVFFKRIFCCAKHGLHIISILAKKVPGNWSELFFLGISISIKCLLDWCNFAPCWRQICSLRYLLGIYFSSKVESKVPTFILLVNPKWSGHNWRQQVKQVNSYHSSNMLFTWYICLYIRTQNILHPWNHSCFTCQNCVEFAFHPLCSRWWLGRPRFKICRRAYVKLQNLSSIFSEKNIWIDVNWWCMTKPQDTIFLALGTGTSQNVAQGCCQGRLWYFWSPWG